MKTKISALILGSLISMCSAQVIADSLYAPSPFAKMDGDNKVVALYGNSYTHYNNHLNTRLRDLTRSILPDSAPGYSYRGITTSSARLGWHEYTLRYQNKLKHWDVVVFQGMSIEPISAKEETVDFFIKSAHKMSRIAHHAESKVVYFMTWAAKAKPEETQKLADAYIDIAQQTGGYVAPVGLAFASFMDQYPEIDLYHSDGKHPSLEGTYLAACILFTTLYNESPVGGAVPVDSDMSEDTARKLQQVAWQTMIDFQY